jgi:hypothetical protein
MLQGDRQCGIELLQHLNNVSESTK